ncbi:hypothetical protein [Arvimicrobium flavum]|uniref:hypothetical protein n=1 Tax=Arvimicrobium flavum TaxID=3393320 RepID=UPI00237AD0E8|nr:hypothetical protein [Mesorhizobium shangrilense]
MSLGETQSDRPVARDGARSLTRRNTVRSAVEFLPDLEAALKQSGLGDGAFGARFFGSRDFVGRIRRGGGVYAPTLAKIEAVLDLLARGELAPAPDPCTAAEYLARLEAARHALGLREGTFARRYLGDGTFFARARRVEKFMPETMAMLERVLAELESKSRDSNSA